MSDGLTIDSTFSSATIERRVAIGSIVNYVLPDDSKHPGEIRPAIVVRVWGQTCVNLQVFIDGDNDYSHSKGTAWVTSATYADPEQAQLRTWHYQF